MVCLACDSEFCELRDRGTLSLPAFAAVLYLRAGGAPETPAVARRNRIEGVGVASRKSAGGIARRPEGTTFDPDQPAVEDLFRVASRELL